MTLPFSQKQHPGFSHKSTLFITIIILWCLLFASCHVAQTGLAEKKMNVQPNQPVIRIHITRQGYNFHRPWQRRPSSTHTAIGVVIEGPRVLVTSKFLANNRYIELERVDNRKKSEAKIEVIDYEANLAVLQPIHPRFLDNIRPLELTTDAVQGDQLAVWQVNPNGAVTPAMGTITSIELTRYPFRNFFLTYRLNSSLQYRFNNFTLPVVKNDKLAGLLMRYDSKSQTIDVVAAPVIEHFLKDAIDGDYLGFPMSGIKMASAEDPQLRRYVGIAGKTGGVYVEKVIKNSAADRAGIREGDIITEIAGFGLDSRGNYDHPIYGKVALSHLTRCEFYVGNSITYRIFRAGNEFPVEVILDHVQPEDYLVPPYIVDKAPRYYILGGMVFQELSGTYLRGYGKEWSAKAPVHLAYYLDNQNNFVYDGMKKIVFLSRVLPTSYTIGYNELSYLVIKRINNKDISKLEDIPTALENPKNGFHKLEFEQRPKVIYLDILEIPKINKQIRERYNLPALKNMNQR